MASVLTPLMIMLLLLLFGAVAPTAHARATLAAADSEPDTFHLCSQRSKTYTGICTSNYKCAAKCKSEYAVNGSCHFKWSGPVCFCYFKC